MLQRRKHSGFSLIEVVVALAMLALIAMPAIGLATLAASRNQEIMTTGEASELKRRIDAAIRAQPSSSTVFDWNLPSSGATKTFLASRNLAYIELDGSTSPANDGFYEVALRSPPGYTFSPTNDAHRLVLYEIRWTPEGASQPAQLVYSSVFRR